MKSSLEEGNYLIDGPINNQNARIRPVTQDLYDEDNYTLERKRAYSTSSASTANTSTNAGVGTNQLTQFTPFLMRKFLKR